MTFTPVPPHSKSAINRAGRLLVSAEVGSKEYEKALEIVDEWRTCHAYPLNTFNSTLHRKARRYPSSLVAQRLKRLPTIIDKLERFPNMNLAQMQDIGGIRAVVDTLGEVRQLWSEYKDQRRFTHKLVKEKNYLAQPKVDGYRGIHLIFQYNNTLARNGLAESYKDLLIELQIRTHLQHTWATAVETTGTFKGESFKTGKGSKEWKEFFALVSSAFAVVEGTPVIPRHSHMSPNEIYTAIKRLEAKLRILNFISGLSAAANIMNTRGISGYYYIISLNTRIRRLSIYTYTRNQLEQATKKYAELEAEAGSDFDQVLVRAGDIKSLKAAYPNYFLDVREFVEKVRVILEEARE